MRRSISPLAGLALVPLGAALLAAQGPARDSAMINRSPNPVLASFRFRSIGPASMGGRVDDIEVAPSDPNVIYVGYATGGVFKSDNNGTTFTPVFETYGSASIGAMAIHPTNANVVYIGTGEANNRQTSSFGDGIYKSEDGGKTFSNVGLKETQTIARIVIDPKSPDVVYVAAPGHLFGPSPDGGVYKTTDGGKSLEQDQVHRREHRIHGYRRWIRRTRECCTQRATSAVGADAATTGAVPGARSGSRTTRGSRGSASLATGFRVEHSAASPSRCRSRIRTWCTRRSKRERRRRPKLRRVVPVLARRAAVERAVVEAEERAEVGPVDMTGATTPVRVTDSAEGAVDAVALPTRRTAHRPRSTAIARAFSDPTTRASRGRSSATATLGRSTSARSASIRATTQNIYVAGVHMAKSLDGGKTFLLLDNAGGFFNMGEDQHAIWVDPKNGNHILRGNDAGFMVTWDQGKTWEYVRTMATALSYWVTADMGHPYYVYTGLQDNDSWAGASATRGRIGLTGQDWFHLTGGDGFQTAVDPTDFHIIYSSSQDGSVSRVDLRTGRATSIRPVPPPVPGTAGTDSSAGGGRGGRGGGRGGRGGGRGTAADSAEAGAPSCVDGRVGGGGGAGRGGGGGGGRGGGTSNVINGQPGEAYRFNWNTPLLMSPHNPGTIWIGGNRLFKSVNRGEKWIESADLTKHIDRCDVNLMGVSGTQAQLSKNDGVTAYGTITAISESPVMPGVVWAGTDDGNLDVSRDDGATFTNVAANLPGLPTSSLNGATAYWTARIEASHFDAATAYVAVDGHRSDDLKPYIFVTHDYGKTFQNIARHVAAIRQRAGRERGPEEQEPALRRHRVRAVHLPRRRCALGEVHDQLSHGAHGRHSDSSARRGRDRRDARAESVDRGRRHAAATVHARGRVGGRAPVRRAERDRVSVRLQDGRGRRRRSPLRGRECSAWDGDQLLPEVGRDGSGHRLDRECARAGGVHVDWAVHGGDSSCAVDAGGAWDRSGGRGAGGGGRRSWQWCGYGRAAGSVVLRWWWWARRKQRRSGAAGDVQREAQRERA